MKLIDLTGQVFGRLTVVRKAPSIDRRTRWICKCVCGSEKSILAENLKRGNTSSCGCLSKEVPHNLIHGYRHHPLYEIYKRIKERCYNKKSKRYSYYGGRGIKMCEEWYNSPVPFIEWALNNGWRKGLHVDKDKKAIEKGESPSLYSPEHCSILTHQENLNYTSDNRRLTAFGVTRTMAQWTRIYGLNPKTIYERLKMGWPTEKAISTPILKTWKRR